MIQLKMYHQEVYDFLSTVTIKNRYFAEQLLASDVAPEFQNRLPDTANPYYRHLNGEYILEYEYDEHGNTIPKDSYGNPTPAVTGVYLDATSATLIPVENSKLYQKFDQMMTVTSFDEPGVTIAFTKENLRKHTKTWAMYKLPSEFYTMLCDRYPQQVDLIKSIVYSLESMYSEEDRDQAIEDAIAAPNYSLLRYDVGRLAENERASIIQCITNFLYMFRTRWDVKEYVYEECYASFIWAALWYHLPLLIFTQRVQNIRTESVHSYHIWEYLGSKGLEDYRTVLTLTQQLFLYKNINYLHHNAGKTSNLKILADALLSAYHINIRTKSIIYHTENGKETCQKSPLIISESLEQDVPPMLSLSNGTESLESIVAREYYDGLEPELNDEVLADQRERTRLAPYTYLSTKLVELNRMAVHERWINFFFLFVGETTLYRASQSDSWFNKSVITLTVDELDAVLPLTGGEAFALMYYCMLKEETNLEEPDSDRWYIPAQARVKECYTTNPQPYPTTVIYDGMQFRVGRQRALGTKHPDIGFADRYAGKAYWSYRNQEGGVTTLEAKLTYDAYDELLGGQSFTVTDDVPAEPEISIMDNDTVFEQIYSIEPAIAKEVQLTDAQKHARLIQMQFAVRLSHEFMYMQNPSTLTAMAMHEFYQCVKPAQRVVALNLVPGYRTYTDWFSSNDKLIELINAIERADNRTQRYHDLGSALMEQLLPFDDKLYDADGNLIMDFTTHMSMVGMDSKRYQKLKELFKQLCSYNIAFLDTESQLTATQVNGRITIGSRRPHSSSTSTVDELYDVKVQDTYGHTTQVYSEGIKMRTGNPVHTGRDTNVEMVQPKHQIRTGNTTVRIFVPFIHIKDE